MVFDFVNCQCFLFVIGRADHCDFKWSFRGCIEYLLACIPAYRYSLLVVINYVFFSGKNYYGLVLWWWQCMLSCSLLVVVASSCHRQRNGELVMIAIWRKCRYPLLYVIYMWVAYSMVNLYHYRISEVLPRKSLRCYIIFVRNGSFSLMTHPLKWKLCVS